MKKTFKIVNEDMSDGYHTFDELYEHRNLLFINLCLQMKDKNICCWRTDYDGWFVLYLELDGKQISYHIQEKFLPLVKDKIHNNDLYKWDGHSSTDSIARLVLSAKAPK